MTDRYPPPSYALSIWLAGDAIMLAIPEAGTIPISLERLEPQCGMITHACGVCGERQVSSDTNIVQGNRGLAVLLDILRSRMASRAPTIGQSAAPVRYDVEQALANDEKYKIWLAALTENKEAKAAQRAEAERVLSEIGL